MIHDAAVGLPKRSSQGRLVLRFLGIYSTLWMSILYLSRAHQDQGIPSGYQQGQDKDRLYSQEQNKMDMLCSQNKTLKKLKSWINTSSPLEMKLFLLENQADAVIRLGFREPSGILIQYISLIFIVYNYWFATEYILFQVKPTCDWVFATVLRKNN